MRLKPLYNVRFRYPEGWEVALTGDAGREVELVLELSELIWEPPAD